MTLDAILDQFILDYILVIVAVLLIISYVLSRLITKSAFPFFVLILFPVVPLLLMLAALSISANIVVPVFFAYVIVLLWSFRQGWPQKAWWYANLKWDLFFARANTSRLGEKFTKAYWYLADKTYKDTYWFGVRTLKNPMDMWQYQEVVFDTKPDIIVETGTAEGGSALFFANIFDIIGKGNIITVDVENNNNLKHKRIKFLHGSSTDPGILEKIRKSCMKKKVMVVLDSDHSKEHVLKELELYAGLVSKGCYLVVEDTLLGQNYVVTGGHAGPAQAVREWLPRNKNFIADKKREKFISTFYPGGWLLRKG